MINALVGFVFAIEKVDDDDVVFLTIAVATSDALFDALRVPGQIVINYQRTELKIDTFRSSFRSNHDAAVVLKIIDESRADVSSFRTCYAIRASMPLHPCGVNLFRVLIRVRAIEENNSVRKLAIAENSKQVVLSAPRFCKDDGLFGRTELRCLSEGNAQSLKQCPSLGVVVDDCG